MKDDISRKAVLMLVAVAVLASVLSTSLVINAVYNYVPSNDAGQQEAAQPAGRVTITVPAQPPSSQGKVVLEVLNPMEE